MSQRNALDRPACGRTAFLISHRPNALRGCTMVVCLDSRGDLQVVERGFGVSALGAHAVVH